MIVFRAVKVIIAKIVNTQIILKNVTNVYILIDVLFVIIVKIVIIVIDVIIVKDVKTAKAVIIV